MANSRVIKNRIKSVKNTGKITKTMAMVATAKSTKAVAQIRSSRPYAEKIREVLGSLGGDGGGHPLMNVNEEAERKLIVAVTANRGLCGGYNTNIVKLVLNQIDDKTDVIMVGKKGASALRYQKVKVEKVIPDVQDVPDFEGIQGYINDIIDAFLSGRYQKVDIVYTKFLSAGSQKAVVEPLLPLKVEAGAEVSSANMDPLFIPDKKALMLNLIPRAVRMAFFKCLLDSAASEHLARQMAMNSASDNANDMVKQLTLTYNRARQAQITTEISEIVGGAEALN